MERMNPSELISRVPQWRPTTWAAVGWLGYLTACFVAAPDPGCTAAQPCGPDWSTAALIVGWLTTVVLLFWQPGVARWTATVVGVVVVVFSNPREDPQTVIYVGSAVLVPFTLWACAHVLRARRITREHHGPAQLWPGQRIPIPVPGRMLLGAGLVAVGALVTLYGYVHQRHEQQWQRDADRVDAVVTKHLADDAIRVQLPDGSTEDFDTLDADYYPVGSAQPVFTDGDKERLVAEQYDGSGWGALGLGGIALGLALLWSGRQERRQLSSFFREPQPVTMVGASAVPDAIFLFEGEGGWTQPRWVLPTIGMDEDEPSGPPEGPPSPPPPPTRATAFGVLAPGEPVGVELDGRFVFGSGPLFAWEADDEEDWRETLSYDPAPQAPDITGALPIDNGTMRPRVRRVTGPLLMLAALAATVWLLTDAHVTGGTLLYRYALCAWFFGNGYVGASLAVEVRPDGLRLRNPLRETRVPWRGVEHFAATQGTVLMFTTDDGVLPVLAVNPIGYGKQRRIDRAERAAAEFQARLEQQRATEAGFVHPNDRRASHIRRWEPGAVALVLAVVSAVAVHYR